MIRAEGRIKVDEVLASVQYISFPLIISKETALSCYELIQWTISNGVRVTLQKSKTDLHEIPQFNLANL